MKLYKVTLDTRLIYIVAIDLLTAAKQVSKLNITNITNIECIRADVIVVTVDSLTMSPAELVADFCAFNKTVLTELQKSCRVARLVVGRKALAYLLKEKCACSSSEVGEILHKDASSVRQYTNSTLEQLDDKCGPVYDCIAAYLVYSRNSR